MTIERELGRGGPRVTTIGLGGNNFGRVGTFTEEQSGTTAVIGEALEQGVTLIDTADMYGKEPGLSESLIGVALRGHRDQVVLASKFGHQQVDVGLLPGVAKGSREYVRAAVEASLRRLRTDWIDLYQIHTPDPETPIGETIAALDELVTEGKIRWFGHSNFSAEQIREAEAEAARLEGGRFVSAQDEYNLINRSAEKELFPAIVEAELGFLPYFPLANGLFTGKFSRTERPDDSRIARQRPQVADDAPWSRIEALERFAQDHGHTLLEATFGWLLSGPVTSVIAGATRPAQVAANAEAAQAWTMTADEAAEIGEIFS